VIVKEKIKKIITQNLPRAKEGEISVNVSLQPKWGDLSSNVLISAKVDRSAQKKLVGGLERDKLISKVEIIGPGFLNIFLSRTGIEAMVTEIIEAKESYGKGREKNKKVQVEYISANPTGPLTLGNGRGAFGGECLARVYQFLGYQVQREYYINDLGRQIEVLGDSIILAQKGKPKKFKRAELYQGEYLTQIASEIKIAGDGDSSLLKIGQQVARQIIKRHIKKETAKLGIEFDRWVYESDLYKKGTVEEALNQLTEKDLIYQKNGASWFRSTNFGDQKDRVVRRKNGEYTYFASDIGYSYDKFNNRSFDRVINLWGADHHGYLDRFKGVLKAFNWLDRWQAIIFQLVRLSKKGKKIRMSKRTGDYILLTDLTKEINLDVAKFLFLNKDFNTPLDIDLEKVRKESKDNPVFYLQYAFARISSLEKKADQLRPEKEENQEYTYNQEERELVLKLTEFPEVVRKVADNSETHLLAYYSNQLAKKFHRFYRISPILKASPQIREKRWRLVQATKYVLKSSLDLMGISQPEKM
jgi:arginyl-tRNA synthetase